MSTLKGPVSALADSSRLAGENVGPWLREYEGYRGTLVFTAEGAQTSHLITLWETPEDEERARASRGAMRDQLAATAGMEVIGFEVFDVVATSTFRTQTAIVRGSASFHVTSDVYAASRRGTNAP